MGGIFDIIKPVLWDAYRHRKKVVASFIAIVIVATVMGLQWKKMYTSHTTIYVDQQNVLGRIGRDILMQTNIGDFARLAQEIIFGRKLMTQIIEGEPWNEKNLSPIEHDRRIAAVSRATTINSFGKNLIKIEFTDTDPQRAFMTTQRIALGYIAESTANKIRESQSAFDFIDAQVQEYENKLKKSEAELQEFKEQHEAIRPGAENEVRRRVGSLRNDINRIEQELREENIRHRSVESQLLGEENTASVLSKSTRYQIRINELQTELDSMRLNYLETYPEIIRIKRQMEDLEKLVVEEDSRRAKAKADAKAAGEIYVEESVAMNPVTQQLQQALYQSDTRIRTLESRLTDAREDLQSELDRGQQIPRAESELTELTREYNVNQSIYEDLLRRREIARVSLNVDREQRGLTLRIYEPAFVPTRPSGPRLLHFILGGLGLGIMVPLVIIFLMQQMDAKVRLLPHITEDLEIPVVGVVPHLATPRENRYQMAGNVILAVLVIATTILVFAVGYMRYQGLI